MSDTDAKESVDIAEVNELEVMVELSFGFGQKYMGVGDDCEVVHGGSKH